MVWNCGMVPLKEKFPDLFAICNETDGSVAHFANRGWDMIYSYSEDGWMRCTGRPLSCKKCCCNK